MTLSVVHLENNIEIYAQPMTVRLPDPLRVVNLRFKVRQLIFEEAGTYLFALVSGEQEIVARRVRVYRAGGSP